MTQLLLLLAQAAPTTQPVPPGGLEVFLKQFFPLLLIIGVFWWIMSRGRTKERQRYEQMLNALKKNDRVLTIGGILGTVVDVRDDEVVLKVDEANNVKVRFTRSAIKTVLADPSAADTKK
ncbi:MAG: preprotein translocase subunit YajC [Planctomycetota bacterium]